ncbi:metallophosphoesterase [Aeromonas dhakensis]|uniref:metallophosphoesterase n=1 Tax=Aeromonas dhakensis TaxID=196024 RepID=UPI001A8BFCF7|nr:metallophosphoesterase [Aeromonas dhakensis]QSR45217.1 metallophosphoesterase [Aeromonas dhakensis]
MNITTHKILKKNNLGTDYFIGDLHGQMTSLKRILSVVNFNPGTDRVICTGDLVDRGAYSLECLRLTMQSWFYSVVGNHEEFILDEDNSSPYKRSIWEKNGGRWWFSLTNEERQECRALIMNNMSFTLSVELAGYHIGVIHSEVPMKAWPVCDVVVNECRREILWGRSVISSEEENSISGADYIIAGHTPVDYPRFVGNQLFLDTGSGYSPNERIHNPHLTACKIQKEKFEFIHATAFTSSTSHIILT